MSAGALGAPLGLITLIVLCGRRPAHAARRTPASARMLVKYCPDLHSPVELLVQNHVMF
jgi:hypothetical protein